MCYFIVEDDIHCVILYNTTQVRAGRKITRGISKTSTTQKNWTVEVNRGI